MRSRGEEALHRSRITIDKMAVSGRTRDIWLTMIKVKTRVGVWLGVESQVTFGPNPNVKNSQYLSYTYKVNEGIKKKAQINY